MVYLDWYDRIRGCRRASSRLLFIAPTRCVEQALISNERSPFEISSSMYAKSMTWIWISPRLLATYTNPSHPTLTSIPLPFALLKLPHRIKSSFAPHEPRQYTDDSKCVYVMAFSPFSPFTSRGRCQCDGFRLVTLSLLLLRASHALIAVGENRCSEAHAWPLFSHRLNELILGG